MLSNVSELIELRITNQFLKCKLQVVYVLSDFEYKLHLSFRKNTVSHYISVGHKTQNITKSIPNQI